MAAAHTIKTVTAAFPASYSVLIVHNGMAASTAAAKVASEPLLTAAKNEFPSRCSWSRGNGIYMTGATYMVYVVQKCNPYGRLYDRENGP
jgi:hypothetical protein